MHEAHQTHTKQRSSLIICVYVAMVVVVNVNEIINTMRPWKTRGRDLQEISNTNGRVQHKRIKQIRKNKHVS